MKSLSVSFPMVVVCAALLIGTAALAADAPAKKSHAGKMHHRPSMPEFLIESPHTPEECTKAMDAIAAQGPKSLDKWSFGCEAGEHTAWAIVHAPNEQAALAMVPAELRDKAKVHKLEKFTPQQVKKMHEKM